MKSSLTRVIRLASVTLTAFSLIVSSASPITSATSTRARLAVWGEDIKQKSQSGLDPAAKEMAIENYGKLPLSFEPNQGQSDPAVKFLSRGDGYTLFLTANEALLALRGSDAAKTRHSLLKLKLVGANAEPKVEGLDRLEGRSNYLIGNDRSKWRTNIPTYGKALYEEVWPGIDMVWYGNQRTLEYDFIVKPGSDPSRISMVFEGADRLRLDDEGNLALKTKAGEVIQKAPVIYQDGEQGRKIIAGKYALRGRQGVGFEVGAYDEDKPLVIDPQLVYSTYVGGLGGDFATGVAVDSGGHAYVTGRADPVGIVNGFPAPIFPFTDVLPAPFSDVSSDNIFIAKLNAAGTALVYCTIISSGFPDVVNAIAVTGDGKACITGRTTATNSLGRDFDFFPITPNAFQDGGSFGACGFGFFGCRFADAFVTALNGDGNDLYYSTYFGGSNLSFGDASDEGLGIAVDSAGRIYISGSTNSNNLPTKNAFQDSRQSSGAGTDAFIAVFNPAAPNGDDTLLYSSFLGGGGDDSGAGIAVDASRNAYVAGRTSSNDLDTKAPAGQPLPPFQASFLGGSSDAFVAKIDTKARGSSSLTYLTYFGGSSADQAKAIAVDSFQRAYVTGATSSSPGSFPLLNPFDSTQNNGEAFVAKFNADGTALFYSSFLGGTNAASSAGGFEAGTGIVVDPGGAAYVTGRTSAGATFPTGVAPPFPSNLQGTAFVTKIEASVSNSATPRLLYSTTFGDGARANAIALDKKGNVYVAGITGGNLPTTAGAFQTAFQGGDSDAFVAKIGATFDDTIGVFRPSTNQFLLRNSNTAGNADVTVSFGQAGDLPVAGDWDGDGDEEVGVFRPSTGQFLLRRSNCLVCLPGQGGTIILNNFGQSGDLPVVGDWNGDGVDTVGLFRNGLWLLSNSPNVNNTTPQVDVPQFNFGLPGDIPVAGDWDGDGFDTVGVLQNGQFAITNFLQDFDPNEAVFFTLQGASGLPVAGDWDGDGVDTVGLFGNGSFSLRNSNSTGPADLIFAFGAAGDRPLAGDWNGRPDA